EEGYEPGIVIQLRPTSPLRPHGLVDRAVGLLTESGEADSVRGVVPSGQNPYKMWRMGEGGRLAPLLQDGPEEAYNQPRQELPPTYWQTGHIDAVRRRTILELDSMSGRTILGVEIDPRFTVDIDNEADWRRAEALAMSGELSYVTPGAPPRPMPEQVEILVLDFDGVLTDNRVWVNAEGEEFVAANRGDGWGLARLREAGVAVVILSTETDLVVKARAEKLGVPVHQGIHDKAPALKSILEEHDVNPANAVFVGNDLNDTPCFPLVACALVPSDAHPTARAEADRILGSKGGHGAVREVCDLILKNIQRRDFDG
ncbi:MAG: acylneuraminate cytidylyltransferase, partial [Anaerolineales bacterium]